jgi:hypothetical protein
MNDIRIPENEWQAFCESFTRQHHGWLVSVCQVDTRDVEQTTAPPARAPEQLFSGSRPLQELREGRTDDLTEVMVTVGEGSDETSFLIQDAVALYNRKSGAAHLGLRVDSGNGTTTLIEFRAAAQPETLDGLAESER